ncbi:MAG: FeoA family protein [Candidatus Roseilinea sp.]|uniref:FeoA family protein n=1 Tax=Candidatus Roseilinea sp. TaxID=2838777 RepID=UPI00404ACEDF
MSGEDRNPALIPLSRVQLGQRAAIARLTCKGAVRQRMLDMGLVPGAEIAVLRVAPLGDPIEFTIKGYHLTLRRSEAEHVQVQVGGAA